MAPEPSRSDFGDTAMTRKRRKGEEWAMKRAAAIIKRSPLFLGADVAELELLDGRKIQICTNRGVAGNEPGVILLRAWPKGGFERHGNLTDLSMSFILKEEGGVDIQDLKTDNRPHNWHEGHDHALG